MIGMVLSSTTKTLEVNDVVCEMLGYEREELLQMTWAQVTHPDDLPANFAYVKRLLAGEIDGYSMDKRYIRKDGTIIYATMSVKCVRGPDGSIDHIVSLVQDVSEAPKPGAAPPGPEDRGYRHPCQGVAHEFNNILTVIMGLGDVLQEALDPNDPLRPYVDQIMASSERAADLTRRLLAFSRKQQIALEPHQVNDVVASSVNLLKRLLPEDIELKMDLADDAAVALLDVNQIEQVLINLATNARDAMPRGGALSLRTERAKLDETFRNAHGFGRPGAFVRLSVSDTGAGMDANTMARIFDPFFTTKEVGKGTGLGLSTVYGIVKQHDGYIDVTSELSKGSTFDIYLPLVDTTGLSSRSVIVETATGGSETILIIEDDADVRRMITTVLIEFRATQPWRPSTETTQSASSADKRVR